MAGKIRLENATGDFSGFESGDGTADVIWKLPDADGSDGEVLTTDGTKVLSWNPIPTPDTSNSSLVGDLKHSMLSQAQINTEAGVGKWLLCNNQSCVGTRYETLTLNATVPDLMSANRYLRAADGTTLVVGQTQTDNAKTSALGITGGVSSLTGTTTFAAHTHTHAGPTHTHAGPNHRHTGPSHTHPYDGRGGTWNNFGAGRGLNTLANAALSDINTLTTAASGTGYTSYAGTNSTGNNTAASTGNNSASAAVGINSPAPALSGASSEETRPVTMAVNIFIKVD